MTYSLHDGVEPPAAFAVGFADYYVGDKLERLAARHPLAAGFAEHRYVAAEQLDAAPAGFIRDGHALRDSDVGFLEQDYLVKLVTEHADHLACIAQIAEDEPFLSNVQTFVKPVNLHVRAQQPFFKR